MLVRTMLVLMLLAIGGTSGSTAPQKTGAPETFIANLNVVGGTGGAGAATIEIDVQRYTPPADLKAVESALKTGGYPAFLAALKKAPQVGAVSFADRKWAIRWAREQKSGEFKRRIVAVTDEPVFFVGGGRVDAKPRAGYEVAVLEIEIDNAGIGSGQMAAAARVKPDGQGGVAIDDYADKPIKLVTVTRKIK
jgi:hypothetical protein